MSGLVCSAGSVVPLGRRGAVAPGARSVQCASQPDRRSLLAGCSIAAVFGAAEAASADGYVNMEALKGKDYGKTPMSFPDYERTASGLQYKDLREGTGPVPQMGQTVVIDWAGFTIGYYGRVFEARNKSKGGDFEGDKDLLRLRLGSVKLVPAVEEAILGMKAGGVRRIIVPEDIGYPGGEYMKWGPSPTTFSGKRTLDFVLKNQGFVDKTLLFDIELMKVVG